MGSFEPIVFLAKLATEAAVVQIAGCSSTQCAERRAHALRHETGAHHIVECSGDCPGMWILITCLICRTFRARFGYLPSARRSAADSPGVHA